MAERLIIKPGIPRSPSFRILLIIGLFSISYLIHAQQLTGLIDYSESLKAKGLKFSISSPEGWIVREGKNPNAVVEFVNNNSGDSFNVVITHGATFVSRDEFRNLQSTIIDPYKEEIRKVFTSVINVSHELITLDNYPFLKFVSEGNIYSDITGDTPCRMITYVAYIEDLIITMTGMEFSYHHSNNKNMNLFDRVARSISLYEQYEYSH